VSASRFRSRAAALLGAAALLVSAASGPARADSAGDAAVKASTPQQRASLQTDWMRGKLGLSPDVAAKVAAINLDTARKMDPVLKGDGNMLARYAQGESIQKERDDALRAVLTPDQFQVFESSKDEMKQKVESALVEQAAAAPGGAAPVSK